MIPSLKSQAVNMSDSLFGPRSGVPVSHFGGLHIQGLYERACKTLWLPRNANSSGASTMMASLASLPRVDPAKVPPAYRRPATHSALAVLALLAVSGTLAGALLPIHALVAVVAITIRNERLVAWRRKEGMAVNV